MFNYLMAIFDWFKDDAIKLLYEYDFDLDSIVVDVGAPMGDLIEKMYTRLVVKS